MLSVDGDANAAVEARIRIGWTHFFVIVTYQSTEMYTQRFQEHNKNERCASLTTT